jgi:very-short-patch-repair endonuclease
VYQARKLRKSMSLPENMLWQRLRAGQLGMKFRRQHPIGAYVVDFYCRDAKLIVEIDGEAHNRGNRPARDAARDIYLMRLGYEIVRIAAVEVLKNADAVAEAIAAKASNPHHQPAAGPPPRAGEDF